MFATLLTVALFALPALQGVRADDFAIGSPASITACTPIKLTWEDTGAAPYNLVVVESTAPCGDILADIGDVNATFYQWDKPSIPAAYFGKNISLSLEDAKGNEAWSGSILYQSDNAGNTCLPGSSSSAAGTTTIPANVADSPATTSAAPSVVAVGAANAGIDPLSSGALTARQMSGSALLVSAVAAAFVFSL